MLKENVCRITWMIHLFTTTCLHHSKHFTHKPKSGKGAGAICFISTVFFPLTHPISLQLLYT